MESRPTKSRWRNVERLHLDEDLSAIGRGAPDVHPRRLPLPRDIGQVAFEKALGCGLLHAGHDSILVKRTILVRRNRSYVLYETLTQAQGGRIATVDSGADFHLPAPDLVESGGRLVLVASPNSPSGTAYPAGELAALARALADEGRVLVPRPRAACSCRVLVIDEAYADFARDSAMGLVTEHDNLVVLRALSKCYIGRPAPKRASMTGLSSNVATIPTTSMGFPRQRSGWTATEGARASAKAARRTSIPISTTAVFVVQVPLFPGVRDGLARRRPRLVAARRRPVLAPQTPTRSCRGSCL